MKQPDIKITMDLIAWQKLRVWTDLAKGEVSALGTVETIIDDNTGQIEELRITDFFLVKQECSSSDTELDPEAVSHLMMEHDPGKLRCWAHSHGTMDIFWSHVDEKNIDGLSNGEWLLSIVVNKNQESLMRLDLFHPTHLFMDDIPWSVNYPIDEILEEECRIEFEEKVKEYIFPAAQQQFRMYPEDFDEEQYVEEFYGF